MVANAASAILERVIQPRTPDLTPEAARGLLQLQFSPTDHARMTELTTRAREGRLTADEQEELDAYVEVGLLIDLLQSKARLSLKGHPPRA
jgi:hypothetical protein